ncbi:hypothetical protein NQ318_014174 [Aromia moschata]|uniref:Uncharacterized protein n=1 Tax=Aromia moschata TaxID=1265417 RepID=A0AAV8Y7Y6_9CUCU|nr:hypothetical protein NQ318_014174 [Aromia moschata]
MEAWFHLSGYVNSHNMRLWNADKLHFYIETPLRPQKNRVWADVSRRRIVGPIFFNGTLNAKRYRLEILTTYINVHGDE